MELYVIFSERKVKTGLVGQGKEEKLFIKIHINAKQHISAKNFEFSRVSVK